MFVTGANLSVPTGTVVLRKGHGLGAQAMAGGSFKAPLFCVGWPTSEFGGMGLEGAVDPANTRRWIATLFDDGAPHWSQQPGGKRRPFVDTY